MNKDKFNALSEDIITKLSPTSLMTLRELGYINAGDMIHVLEIFSNTDELVNHVLENHLDEVKEAIQEAYS